MTERNAFRGALEFEAPWLVEKLLKERIVESEAEAEALFREVKRYLVVAASDRTKSWSMPSLRVDEVWHQFVLFTVEYSDYCTRFLGEYMHHAPSNAPGLESSPERTGDLFQRYEMLFGEPLPAVWIDHAHVRPATRAIRRDFDAPLAIVKEGDDVALVAGAEVVARVDAWGEPALRFIADNDAFFVRELPPPLEDEDRVALCSALVRSGTLRVAP